MTIEDLNKLSTEEAYNELQKCCGSSSWVNAMIASRPFTSAEDLMNKADQAWASCNTSDAYEAFTHHPKIGDISNLEKKFASTSAWAGGEQQGVNSAARETLLALAKGNDDYENKFGYIFIVCATGKSAPEMLELLQSRLPNDPGKEIQIAMTEQHKITKIRLEKLLA